MLTYEEIIKKTGIPRGSFFYWCNRAGVQPIGKPYQKPGANHLMFNYPDDSIEKIKNLYDLSKSRRAGRL